MVNESPAKVPKVDPDTVLAVPELVPMRLYSLKLTALARTVSEPVVPDAGKEAKVPTIA